ncbi:MAG TPA: hypothetical protein VGL40_00215 [Bacillota bacterium]
MLEQGILKARPRPLDEGTDSEKRVYGTRLSGAIASVVAADLRAHGLTDCLPNPPRGVEREFAGGIGAKKVDVSWSSEEAGLLLAISIKTINFADRKTGNYQKNLTNRRGDMLFEAVTLHRRFPYAVLGGLLFLHCGAEKDQGKERQSTLDNAHDRFRLFTRRQDPGDREEQLERMWLASYSDDPAVAVLYEAGKPGEPILWNTARDELLRMVAERNPDHLVYASGNLTRRR